MLSSAHQTEM